MNEFRNVFSIQAHRISGHVFCWKSVTGSAEMELFNMIFKGNSHRKINAISSFKRKLVKGVLFYLFIYLFFKKEAIKVTSKMKGLTTDNFSYLFT